MYLYIIQKLKTLNIAYTNKSGSTALIFAAQSGTPEHVKLLVDAGADVNIQNLEGVKIFILQKEYITFWSHIPPAVYTHITHTQRSALFYAVEREVSIATPMIELLLNANANIRLRDCVCGYF
jgi:hypothetical protein